MKKTNWYRGLSLADDKFISEAAPQNKISSKRKKIFISFAAACASFVFVICSLWLFVPFKTSPPDVSKFEGSEYYDIIQKLNVLTFEKPRYKNNAEKLFDNVDSYSLFSFTKGDAENLTQIQDSANSESYKEITDNQVEGIVEADRIKRSDKYIYYLDNETLRIFSIDKEKTLEIGQYNIYEGKESNNLYFHQGEFYLSEDCKTVTVITQYHKKNFNNRFVNLISLDVSDPKNIVKKEEFSITGRYMSSRMSNGNILLLTEFVINKNELDFNDESTFLPLINKGNGYQSISPSEIISPEVLNDARYTVALKLDEKTLTPKGVASYLSYSEDVYVSETHIFLTHVFADKKKNEDDTFTRNSMTEISCLTYGGDSFEIAGTVTVRGYVKDQWSMDEYEGILRVFTTTNATTLNETYFENTVSTSKLQTATGKSNASLYCINLSNFQIVASVCDFAPPREEIQSVRFDKESAYVCTSIELSDPVFFFDLSDLNNIKYKDTGTIEGFSTSLINLGDGYLLGIGIGERWNIFKVEVYEETPNGVRSICSYELNNTEYSTEYKSYYIDRQNKLIGLGVVSNGESKYILLHFDQYELSELINVSLCGETENMRGVFIDGYMYMFGNNDFKVEKVFE